MKKISLFVLFVCWGVNLFALDDALQAKIIVPYPNVLIRGDVPIYGIACGKDFKAYELAYGRGEKPDLWVTISRSEKEEKSSSGLPNINFSIDKTIPGNLGIWDTGLTEYSYGEHKVDLPMGIYTLKLTVFGKTGETKEDRVIVEVGRVVLNSSGGKLISPDGKARLTIQEHSLYSAVRVFSLKSIDISKHSWLGKEYTLVGEIYELNPPGEKFNQNAVLEIGYDHSKVSNRENLGIFVFNPNIKRWEHLETFRNDDVNVLTAMINSVPEKFALYAVGEGKDITNSILRQAKINVDDSRGEVLCNNDFESGFNQWKNKYGEVGALLELDKGGAGNGQCLKLTAQGERGNFASAVISKPFDAQKYQIVSFDYKIPSDIKINFLVKVNGKWFDIVFTDDEKIYWDINMEKGGEVPNVNADDKWHHAEFNLFDMLKGRTNSYVIEEMELADWDCIGFMKLEFGHTRKGSSFYIDNFEIKSAL